MSADEIAGAFVQHYYGTLDNNIAGLGALYVRQEGVKERKIASKQWISGGSCVCGIYLC